MNINRKLLEEFAAAAVLTTSDIEVFNIGHTIITEKHKKTFNLMESLSEKYDTLGLPVVLLSPDDVQTKLKAAADWKNTPETIKKLIRAGKPTGLEGDEVVEPNKNKNELLIHGSKAIIAGVKTPNGIEYDPVIFAKLIMVRPETLLAQNSKMEKSNDDDGEYAFYNTTLPALLGLTVDEDKKPLEFYVVKTCSQAASCKLDCFARGHGYVAYPDVTINQNRILNYIFNDKDGYIKQMIEEINHVKRLAAKILVSARDDDGLIIEDAPKVPKKLVIRWNDSGDTLSPEYKKIQTYIEKKCPTVEFYAYTKEVLLHKLEKREMELKKKSQKKSDRDVKKNSTTRYSLGGHQDANIDLKKDLHAHIVNANKVESYEITKKNRKGEVVTDSAGEAVKIQAPNKNPDLRAIKSKKYIVKGKGESWRYADKKAVKEIIAKHYNVDVDSIFTVDEIAHKAKSKETPAPYHVIVLPGESDDPARRRDVLGIYLIKH